VSSGAAADQSSKGDLWSHKPWWCQPWTIVVTGCAVPLFGWLLFGWLWLTLVLSVAVLGWWLVFLVLAPAAYRQALTDVDGDSGDGGNRPD